MNPIPEIKLPREKQSATFFRPGRSADHLPPVSQVSPCHRSTIHPEAHASRRRPIRPAIAAKSGRGTDTSTSWKRTLCEQCNDVRFRVQRVEEYALPWLSSVLTLPAHLESW